MRCFAWEERMGGVPRGGVVLSIPSPPFPRRGVRGDPGRTRRGWEGAEGPGGGGVPTPTPPPGRTRASGPRAESSAALKGPDRAGTRVCAGGGGGTRVRERRSTPVRTCARGCGAWVGVCVCGCLRGGVGGGCVYGCRHACAWGVCVCALGGCACVHVPMGVSSAVGSGASVSVCLCSPPPPPCLCGPRGVARSSCPHPPPPHSQHPRGGRVLPSPRQPHPQGGWQWSPWQPRRNRRWGTECDPPHTPAPTPPTHPGLTLGLGVAPTRRPPTQGAQSQLGGCHTMWGGGVCASVKLGGTGGCVRGSPRTGGGLRGGSQAAEQLPAAPGGSRRPPRPVPVTSPEHHMSHGPAELGGRRGSGGGSWGRGGAAAAEAGQLVTRVV
ncbi:translation initiation factor IF-2-like, partial [Tyto alba]|uniref:translation initiation factor IF-2-like n=1 Tax=Tyto alba TaxID=56313 RepID=UPI001C66D898